tara:strand:+ start:5900 stop:6421 length:522 start_codon:yes stop_codon:yes gene_type:complete
MQLKEVNKKLNEFGKYVVSQSRANLSRGKKNYTKNLWESLNYTIDQTNAGPRLYFEMDDYGMFQDKGVKGKNPKLVKNGKQKAPNSQFRFTKKMPPQKPLMEWAKKKNIRLRDSKGKYQKGSYQTIGFILQKRIFAQGIKPSLFFTKPFEKAFKNLPPELGNSFGIDIENLLS